MGIGEGLDPCSLQNRTMLVGAGSRNICRLDVLCQGDRVFERGEAGPGLRWVGRAWEVEALWQLMR